MTSDCSLNIQYMLFYIKLFIFEDKHQTQVKQSCVKNFGCYLKFPIILLFILIWLLVLQKFSLYFFFLEISHLNFLQTRLTKITMKINSFLRFCIIFLIGIFSRKQTAAEIFKNSWLPITYFSFPLFSRDFWLFIPRLTLGCGNGNSVPEKKNCSLVEDLLVKQFTVHVPS